MQPSSPFQGVVVPLATPFTSQGLLDASSAARLVDHVATGRVGVFVLGTTGEAASIPTACRRRYAEIAVQTAKGRVPVYAGIGDNCTSASIEAAREYLRLGVDAVVAHLPSYYLLNPAEMRAYFELLAREIPGPIILYNIPQTTRMSLPIEVAEALSHLPNIVGLKDSENTDGRLEKIASTLGGRSDFSIFMGIAKHSVAALKKGFHGLVPSSGNIAPALWHQLHSAALAGDWAAAEALQLRLDALAQVFQKDRSLGESLAALKGALTAQNLTGPAVLPPLRTLDEAGLALVRTELATHALT